MEWAEYASHSHNGYLDTALSMGLPGLALLIVVLVIVPLRNFQAADRGGNNGPLTMAFLRIWLFGLYLSSLESFFLDRADPTVVHVSGGGVWAALSGALSREGVRRSELRPHGQRDILPPAVEIERRLHRRPFQRRDDPVGVDLVIRSALNQHDRAAIDQFLEARMMVELVRLGRAGDDDGPAGLHAGENAGTPRGETFIEQIAEGVDLR